MLKVFFTAFVFTAFVGTCMSYIVAATRKKSWALKVKPQRTESFSTTVNPEESLKSIVRFAQTFGYKISNLDEVRNQALLEETTSLWNYGFFFPVSVLKKFDSSTLIDVGIKSKFIHPDPIVSRSHKKCLNGIKAALVEQSRPKGELVLLRQVKPTYKKVSDLALSQQATNTLPDLQKSIEELQVVSQKHKRQCELRHLDIRIAEVFLLYTSVKWGKNYINPTGIPKTMYDNPKFEDNRFRETIPRYSTDKSDYSLIKKSAIGSGLHKLFLQILAEKGLNKNASLEQKCIAWLEARTEQIKRRAKRHN